MVPKSVVVVVGTRPEVIKMAPLVHALGRHDDIATCLVSTGQHRDMAAQSLASFDLDVDRDLGVMRQGQALAPLTARLLERMTETLRDVRPDAVLVQGDTTTVLAAGLAAFYERIPLGHVSASPEL